MEAATLPLFPVDQASDKWHVLTKVAARVSFYWQNWASVLGAPWLVYSNKHPGAIERKMQGWRAKDGPI
jgi:hypothetical protein